MFTGFCLGRAFNYLPYTILQFDVTFPALQCSIISLDSMDISGERHLDVVRAGGWFFSVMVFFFQVEMFLHFCLIFDSSC